MTHIINKKKKKPTTLLMSKHLKIKSFGYVILTDFYSNFILNINYTEKKDFFINLPTFFNFYYSVKNDNNFLFEKKNGFHFDRIIFIIRYYKQYKS